MGTSFTARGGGGHLNDYAVRCSSPRRSGRRVSVQRFISVEQSRFKGLCRVASARAGGGNIGFAIVSTIYTQTIPTTIARPVPYGNVNGRHRAFPLNSPRAHRAQGSPLRRLRTGTAGSCSNQPSPSSNHRAQPTIQRRKRFTGVLGVARLYAATYCCAPP